MPDPTVHPNEDSESHEAEMSEWDLYHGDQADRVSYTTKRRESLGGPFRDDAEGLAPEDMVNNPEFQGTYPFQEVEATTRERGPDAYDEAEQSTDNDYFRNTPIPAGEWQGTPHDSPEGSPEGS